MKAAIYKSYGSPEVMEIMDVEKPFIKDEDRVLIKVVSASVNKYDTLYRKGYLPTRMENGLTKPKTQILGIDVAGIVEAVGKNVKNLKLGIMFLEVVSDHMLNMSAQEKVFYPLCQITQRLKRQPQYHALHRPLYKHYEM